MSAAIMYAGLAERLLTVAGIKAVMLGEPTAIHEPPAIYTVLAPFARSQHGQVTAMRYTFIHRLFIQWQDNPQAEAQLLSFINLIPASVDASPTLGGRIVQGLAQMTAGDPGYVTVSGTMYRICDFVSDVLEKNAVRSGI